MWLSSGNDTPAMWAEGLIGERAKRVRLIFIAI